MIRNVVICTFRDDARQDEIDEFLDAVGRLHTEGLRAVTFGLDRGLRLGNASYALVADFDDEAAYRRYDEDPEHQRIRSELASRLVVAASRVQFTV